MRFCFAVMILFTAFLSAQNASEAYDLAEKYEQANDTKNALFWYKRSAQLSSGNASEFSAELQEALANDEKYERLQNKYLADYQDNVTKDAVFQTLSASFGIIPYHSNFVLPLTYDFTKRENKDRRNVETSFQFSIRKDFINDFFGFDERIGVAYTQRSWWQTMKHSTPFRETNYQPEVYITLPFWNDSSHFKEYKIALVHESNGQNDPISRSWNRLYLEGFFQIKGVFIKPRIWYRIPESKADDNNPDITDYMGYGDLTLSYPYKEHMFKLLLRNNMDFDHNKGAVQLEWTFPIFKSGAFGLVHFFSGYGDSLIDYNDSITRVGIGVALSR